MTPRNGSRPSTRCSVAWRSSRPSVYCSRQWCTVSCTSSTSTWIPSRSKPAALANPDLLEDRVDFPEMDGQVEESLHFTARKNSRNLGVFEKELLEILRVSPRLHRVALDDGVRGFASQSLARER